MKRYFRFFVIFLAFSCWIPHTASAQVVRVPDANLAALVRNALDLTANTPITRQAMQRLTFLDAQSYRIRQITGRGGQIKDITGLEHATQLTRLWLNNNQISDVRPLSGLTQLEALNIWNNQISDVRPLSGLTQLEALYLSDNPISNFQPLAGLTQLRHLGISVRRINDLHRHVDLTRLESLALQGSGNQISDLDFLTNLTQLTNLDVNNAQIRDLRFLRGLSQLKRLGLRGNQISNLQSLSDLTQLESLFLLGNEISDLKPLTNLTQLRLLNLGSNQISDLKPLASLTRLRYLYLWNNQIRNVTPLAGLINLEVLFLDGNPIQDTSPVASLPNLRHKDFHIPPTLSIRDENPSEIPRVGNTLTYRVQIRNAQNVTGFNLAYSTPHKLTSVQSVGFFSGTEHNLGKTLRTGTLKASRLNTGQLIHNVGIFTLNATSAGTGELRVVGKLTTTQRIFNVDTRFPLTIFPSDAPVSTEVVPAIDSTPRLVGAGIVPDPNLAAAVRKALGLGPSAPITKQVMRKLTELRAKNSQITDLTGLEHATQLRTLSLADNQISDLTPLAKLTQLKGISLFRNQIKNLTPLAKLTQLTWLDLGGNQVRNIAPLASLTQLDWLSLWGNQITNLRPLAGLTQLSKLDIPDNRISNITPLANLTNLISLELRGNQISNVRPLAKLIQLRELHLGGNQINNINFLTGLTKLKTLYLWDNKISDITPIKGLIELELLSLTENQIRNINPIAELTRLKELRLGKNQIRDVTPLAGLVNLEVLKLEQNPIQDTSLLARLTKLRDVDVEISKAPSGSAGVISDPKLASAVRKALGLGPKARITKQVMRKLTELRAKNSQIADLTGLEQATQLTRLDLQENKISDLSPLTGLKQLRRLDLWMNQIRDISPLKGLTNLTGLFLSTNHISDLTPLAGLTQLRGLDLSKNQIQDVSPLAGLTQLEALELLANQIQDVSPLAKLINLKKLRIRENPIQDTSPLASLTKLSEVDIEITQPSVPDGTPVVAATDAVVSISPSSVVSPAIGEQLILNLNIAGGESVAGYQVILQFDPTAFRYVESSNGDYLPTSAFFVPPVVNRGSIELASAALTGVSNGGGTLATVTFEVLTVKTSTLTLSEPLLADSQGNTFRPQVEAGEVTEPPKLKGDVTGDGIVNIQDLVLIASSFGQTGEISADVNGDGVVNIADLVLVAGALRNTAAAPILHPQLSETLTAADVHQWLSQTQLLDLRDATTQRGIRYLAQLLRVLTPKETVLLPNYPNPFNPETWIPYQLAKPADVTLTIYAGTGEVVRRLVLGHQAAGLYQSRSRAAYWDGRNALGEPVASGIYFYTLTVGDFTATRKMLILK